jgi:hypothetical protein
MASFPAFQGTELTRFARTTACRATRARPSAVGSLE